MLIRPVAAGLWLVGAEFYMTPAPVGWSFADLHDCPCQVWSATLPLGRHCDESSVLVPLACGAPMDLMVYSEPTDRMFPIRLVTVLGGYFKPGDVNLDGQADLSDFADFHAEPYDFDQDGAVTVEDAMSVIHWIRWCP